MIKTLLAFVVTFLLFFLPFIGFSQCPTSGIFTSQAQIDAFPINYPNCTDFDESVGWLDISGDDIIDLSPLSGLTNAFEIYIHDTALLSDLDGLQNISGATGLYGPYVILADNQSLTDISALNNITTTNGNGNGGINIRRNPALLSLNGLQGFSSILEFVDILDNDSLINLIGLNNITAADDFYVTDNDNLINLNGLDSCAGGAIIFENNSSLQNLVGLTSSFNGGLVALINNSSLASLQGIEEITATADLYLDGNESLTDISALLALISGNPSFPEISIVIKNNINLSTCHINAICSTLNLCNSGDYYCSTVIENNGTGCNSIAEVAFACGLVPSNDECEDALPLIIGQTTQAYNENGTASSQVPSCNDTNRVDVWFTVNSGSFTSLHIIAETGYSLQLWEGNCSSLSQVANACAEGNLNDIPVTSNTNYYVQVWSDSNTLLRSTGLFDILVQDGTLSSTEFAFENFSMYPNPVNHVLNLKGKTAIETVSIYNLLGQPVLVAQPKVLEATLNMSSLQTGIYLVKVTIGTEVATYKIIKE